MVMLLLLSCTHAVSLDWDTGGAAVDSMELRPDDSDPEILPSDTTPDDTEDTQDTQDSDVVVEIPEYVAPERVPDVVVDCAGGGDYLTITEAIAGSVSGMKIGLRPCTYNEDINFNGKSLDIFGIEGSAATQVVGTGTTATVLAIRGESVGTRLAGVTVSGGRMTDSYGSGLYVYSAMLQLEDVVLTGALDGYSVVYGQAAFLEMVDVTIKENTITAGGYALVVDNGSIVAQRFNLACEGIDYGFYQHNSLILLDSDLRCGDAYGVIVSGGELHMRRSTVVSPGMGIYGEDNDDTRNERLWLQNNVIVGEDAGAVYSAYMHVKAENNVFWGGRSAFEMQYAHIESYLYNNIAVGSRCGLKTDGYAYAMGWNAIQGTVEACNVDAYSSVLVDPAFVEAPEDFHLSPGSPAIDAGNPDKSEEDVDGTRNDLGAYGGPEGEGAR